MKLSPEAQTRVKALLSKATYDLALWKREDHDRILRQAKTDNPRFTELGEHYTEVIRRAFTAIINSYVEGYRMDGTLIDDEDENEILKEIKSMIDSNHHHIFNSATNRDFRNPVTGDRIPNIDTQVRERFDELYGEAAIDLKFARSDLMVELRKKSEDKSGAVHNVNIYGHNYGGVQQGPNNTQNLNLGIQYRNGKPQIKWSQLKPGVGMQRVLEIGDVQVTEIDIQQAAEVGGDPWVQLHEISTFGSSIKTYALGQFTPA